MNKDERLQLKKMIDANNVEDQTETIRKLKHSNKIRDEVVSMQRIIVENNISTEKEETTVIHKRCIETAPLLYENYNDIFHKIVKQELNMKMFSDFLNVLKKIEDGELDQHEGSYMVGTILKNIYIDSAVRHGDNIDAQHTKEDEKPNDGMGLSWSDFKKRLM